MFVSAHISVSFQDIHTCAIPDLTKAEVSAAANSKKKANISWNRIFFPPRLMVGDFKFGFKCTYIIRFLFEDCLLKVVLIVSSAIWI